MFLNYWFNEIVCEKIIVQKVIYDHKRITWSSSWISSFPIIYESLSYVNFNMIQYSRAYKRP